MDEIIRKIYKSLKANDLLIVLSDHGMANEGGHGGSSHMEIMTPVLFVSQNFDVDRSNQNDILLLPIPKNHCLNILGYYLVN